MIHWYLGFEHVNIIEEDGKFYMVDETGQIQLFDKFGIGIAPAEDTYVEGFLTIYRGELELYPIQIGIGNPYDVNGDGEVNISDINAVIDAILSGNHSVGDVNGDHEVNISDVSDIIDYILTH